MTLRNCNICGNELEAPCYESARSLTSLCEVFPSPTVVRCCSRCGHAVTEPIEDLSRFYDEEYAILSDSEDEDQVYEVTSEGTVYRTEHQMAVMEAKIELQGGARILDYGCAKSSMMRVLSQRRPDITPFLFDVTERYRDFWRGFAASENCATYQTPDSWAASFDVVTSFFSLEHIADPLDVLRNVRSLLRPNGIVYGIVPNVLTNYADLLVIDHVNHFTEPSLHEALRSSGFARIDIDTDAHRGAFVFTARNAAASDTCEPGRRAAEALAEVQQIAGYWNGASTRVQQHEQTFDDRDVGAIYGAGFYGSFIYSALTSTERLACFVDQNEYLQGRQLATLPIVPPGELPADVTKLFVGLNPAHARAIIGSVPEFAARDLSYIYL